MQKGDLVTIKPGVLNDLFKKNSPTKLTGKIETITNDGKVIVGVRMFFDPQEIEDVL